MYYVAGEIKKIVAPGQAKKVWQERIGNTALAVARLGISK
jgi:hypothetical protein